MNIATPFDLGMTFRDVEESWIFSAELRDYSLTASVTENATPLFHLMHMQEKAGLYREEFKRRMH